MRALITGYGGFAGGHLADHLQAETDWELWGSARDDQERAGILERPIQVRAVDLRDPEATLALLEEARPDLIFHLAGQTFVPEAWRAPWDTLETNLRMQLNLLESVVALGGRGAPTRMVVVSSNEVYGAPPPEAQPTDEDAPLAPANAYASSKTAQDLLAGQYVRSHDLHVVRVRPFTHIGPRQSDRFVASSFARQVAECEAGLREPVLRVGNLEAERDFSDVRDIVRAYRLAAERGTAGAVYNLGSGRARPVRDILDHLVAAARVPLRVETDPTRLRPSDVPRTLCDPRLAAEALGWTCRISLEESLDDLLAHWRSALAAAPADARPAPRKDP